MHTDQTIHEQALDWAVRTADPAFEAWDAFAAWIESDPAHAQAYDAVAASAADAAEALAAMPAPAPAANDDEFVQPHWFSRRAIGGALAAMLVLVAVFVGWRGDGSYSVETAPGETRLVELDGGVSIELAGGTLIELDRDEPRFARLEHGQAAFTIVHDESDPFVLLAGGHRLVDAGTVFDVNLRSDGLSLGVSEGLVVFEPDAEAVQVSPGHMLFAPEGEGAVRLTEILPEQVGEWREGRLTFEQVSLPVLADELTRATGMHFVAANGDRREISGSIMFGSVADDPYLLQDLLGVSVRPDGQGWVIEGK